MKNLQVFGLMTKDGFRCKGYVVVDPKAKTCYINDGVVPSYDDEVPFAFCDAILAEESANAGELSVHVPLRTLGIYDGEDGIGKRDYMLYRL